MRLRVLGEPVHGGAGPHLLNELYSSGVVSSAERDRLEELSRVKARVVHGFASPGADAAAVGFLADLARRLVAEARPVKQPA